MEEIIAYMFSIIAVLVTIIGILIVVIIKLRQRLKMLSMALRGRHEEEEK